MDYLTWTYFFRRLLVNPTYYELESVETTDVNRFLSFLVQGSLNELVNSGCIEIGDDGDLTATTSGRIASFYYLTNKTLKLFQDAVKSDVDIDSLIEIVSQAKEFAELPVRHNEDKLNAQLSNDVPLKVNQYTLDSPHTKCNLLLQAHFSQIPLPISDYITDTKSVLDQCLRVMQAMLDFTAERGWCQASLAIITLMQMSCQARWYSDSDLITMPHLGTEHLSRFFGHKTRIDCLPRLIDACEKSRYERLLEDLVGDLLDRNQIREIYQAVSALPQIEVKVSVCGETIDKKSKSLENIDFKNEEKVYTLQEDEDYILKVDLAKINKSSQLGKRGRDSKAYAPKYPKPKDENWVIILGANCHTETAEELVGLKRINNLQSRQMTNLSFRTPMVKEQVSKAGQLYTITVFLMSDVYLGLDQQYELKFNLTTKK